MTLADQAAITGHDGQVTSGGKPGRPRRRTFTAVYKVRILAAYDALQKTVRARRPAAEGAHLPFSSGGLAAAAGRRFPGAGREEGKEREKLHSQAEYPADQQVDDLEQHAASQPSRRSGCWRSHRSAVRSIIRAAQVAVGPDGPGRPRRQGPRRPASGHLTLGLPGLGRLPPVGHARILHELLEQRNAFEEAELAGHGGMDGSGSVLSPVRRILVMCFVAAEQPDVPCTERDLLPRWMALAAEYVGHRGGGRCRRLSPAPVMQDV
jgi:hypothetical protein